MEVFQTIALLPNPVEGGKIVSFPFSMDNKVLDVRNAANYTLSHLIGLQFLYVVRPFPSVTFGERYGYTLFFYSVFRMWSSFSQIYPLIQYRSILAAL